MLFNPEDEEKAEKWAALCAFILAIFLLSIHLYITCKIEAEEKADKERQEQYLENGFYQKYN